jgi:hypothetical protein
MKLHGVEVTAPWDCEDPDALFPPPLPAFLELHYFSSIFRAMKACADDNELDDGDDDEEEKELSELEEVPNDKNEQVRVWVDGCGEYVSLLGFTVGNKGNTETLAVQGVVCV